MSVRLEILKKENKEQFIKDNQFAFKYGAMKYFSESEMEKQYEEDGEIISRETIINSINHKGSIAYQIFDDSLTVGGIVININKSKGDLELFFVNPDCHSKGIGQSAWREIERLHPNVKIWETVTPAFEKRNIHFYVNKLGFHIVKYYNKYYKDPSNEEDLWEMYQFEKVIK